MMQEIDTEGVRRAATVWGGRRMTTDDTEDTHGREDTGRWRRMLLVSPVLALLCAGCGADRQATSAEIVVEERVYEGIYRIDGKQLTEWEIIAQVVALSSHRGHPLTVTVRSDDKRISPLGTALLSLERLGQGRLMVRIDSPNSMYPRE